MPRVWNPAVLYIKPEILLKQVESRNLKNESDAGIDRMACA